MATKRKTKLVCVGWGIWIIKWKCLWYSAAGHNNWSEESRCESVYDEDTREGTYQRHKEMGGIIAKKLWVEVK